MIEFFETLVDGDSIDETAAYILLNNAKNKIEGERPWVILQCLDASQTASSSAKPLPTDFNRPISEFIYVDRQPYSQIPFEQQRLFANSGLRWYLDMKNGNYYLLGSNLSGQIYFPYIYQTPNVSALTSPVWPERFHIAIPFEMAELFYAIDQGERSLAWDDKWALQKQLTRQSMIDWDVGLQKYAVMNSIPADMAQETEYPLSMM